MRLPCVSLKIIAHLRTLVSQSDSSFQQPCSINQHNIMISEGSYDTEDWSNDAENKYLPSGQLITFKNK